MGIPIPVNIVYMFSNWDHSIEFGLLSLSLLASDFVSQLMKNYIKIIYVYAGCNLGY